MSVVQRPTSWVVVSTDHFTAAYALDAVIPGASLAESTVPPVHGEPASLPAERASIDASAPIASPEPASATDIFSEVASAEPPSERSLSPASAFDAPASFDGAPVVDSLAPVASEAPTPASWPL